MSKRKKDTPVELEDARLSEVASGAIYMKPAGVASPLNPSSPTSPIATTPITDGSKGLG